MTDAALANSASSTPAFCEDDELGYRRSLSDLTTSLTLDESYRLAHLPLVAPGHPRIVARREGKFYEMGTIRSSIRWCCP